LGLLQNLRFVSTAALAFLLSMSAGAASVSIGMENGAFRIQGWNAPSSPPHGDWSSIFSVRTGPGDAPALLGSYAVESGVLVFRPKYPIAAGVRYRAVFHPPGGASIEQAFNGPPLATNPIAHVGGFYPSADVLPENLLRVYILFSAPMSRGEAGARVHMLDAKGAELRGVFLPGEELWDPVGTRLTLTLDPGRIKRGLTSNMAMGAPIQAGKQYSLVIDRDWRDARGVAMTEGFRKQFRGGPPDRVAPDPKTWTIVPPKAGTSEALSVNFPAPMNYALLQRMIQVSGKSGNVGGSVSTADEEKQWRLTPQSPWKPGVYQLVVDTALEDLAGNHIGQLFDIDVFDHVTQHIATRTISLPFSVR
jgi:hypothetical protein